MLGGRNGCDVVSLKRTHHWHTRLNETQSEKDGTVSAVRNPYAPTPLKYSDAKEPDGWMTRSLLARCPTERSLQVLRIFTIEESMVDDVRALFLAGGVDFCTSGVEFQHGRTFIFEGNQIECYARCFSMAAVVMPPPLYRCPELTTCRKRSCPHWARGANTHF